MSVEDLRLALTDRASPPAEHYRLAAGIRSFERLLRDARGFGATAYARVGAKSTPIPSARALEDVIMPQVGDVVAAVLDCL